MNQEAFGPGKVEDVYLIVSFCRRREDFETSTGSPEFLDCAQREFADLRRAKTKGRERR